MYNQKHEVVNSKAGRTTAAEAGARTMTSVLEAIQAKYNLPITAFDWLDPTVQVLNYRLSEINDGQSDDVKILSIKGLPIVFNPATKNFFPEGRPECCVNLEECVCDDEDEPCYNRIDFSHLACRLGEIEKEASRTLLSKDFMIPLQLHPINKDEDLFYFEDVEAEYALRPRNGEWDGQKVLNAINSLLPEGMSFRLEDSMTWCLDSPNDDYSVVPVMPIYPVDKTGSDDYDPIAYLSLGLVEMLRNEMKKES